MNFLPLEVIMVIPIVDDECLEAAGCLRFYPVLEDEAKDSTSHLKVT